MPTPAGRGARNHKSRTSASRLPDAALRWPVADSSSRTRSSRRPMKKLNQAVQPPFEPSRYFRYSWSERLRPARRRPRSSCLTATTGFVAPHPKSRPGAGRRRRQGPPLQSQRRLGSTPATQSTRQSRTQGFPGAIASIVAAICSTRIKTSNQPNEVDEGKSTSRLREQLFRYQRRRRQPLVTRGTHRPATARRACGERSDEV